MFAIRRSSLCRTAWWALLAAGLLLRLWFLAHPMIPDDDTDVYADLARNLFHHGVYGITDGKAIDPTLIRLPGYPIFLGTILAVFGDSNFNAVLLAQIGFDLLGCWLVARFVRENVSERAGIVALALTALCPFTAAYSAQALTECLSIFAVSLALWAAGRVLRAQSQGRMDRVGIAFVSLASGIAMLLRPDGALVMASIVIAILWYGLRQDMLRPAAKNALLCMVLAGLPLAPWTLRNWRTFHVIQPLAPRRVNDPGEFVAYGFYRWMGTWSVDIVSTGAIFWVNSGTMDINDLPARALDSPAERAETAALFAEYNATKSISPAMDARFSALAATRIREHPFRCRVWVPALRVMDMLLRPRTETLDLDPFWWRFPGPATQRIETATLGLLNIALVVAGLVGLLRARVPWAVFPIAYIVLRCLLLSTMENSEPRYTLEMLPIWTAWGACVLAGDRHVRPRSNVPTTWRLAGFGAGLMRVALSRTEVLICGLYPLLRQSGSSSAKMKPRHRTNPASAV
jgi:hypothetical protein